MKMDNTSIRIQKISEAYSKEYWKHWPDIVDDLIAKFNNCSHIVSSKKVNNIFRAVLTFDYIKKTFGIGATVLDMGCGIGYNSCFLAKEGFKVQAFDISKVGISRAKELAQKNGVDPNIFSNCDHIYLDKIPSESIDVVIAMGLIYYLDNEARDYCYRQVRRILKNQGKFILTCTNQLFDTFALNDFSLRFWAKMIDDFSPVSKLLSSKSTLDALQMKVKVPKRRFEKNSISARYSIHTDNPLIYKETVKPYGYEVEDILYPDSHLLPPSLEAEVDIDSLLELKAKTCVQKARDWRGMFMCYEFLVFLSKTEHTQ